MILKPGASTSTGGSSDFADDVFSVHDNVDATKILKFELSDLASPRTVTVRIPEMDTAGGEPDVLVLAQESFGGGSYRVGADWEFADINIGTPSVGFLTILPTHSTPGTQTNLYNTQTADRLQYLANATDATYLPWNSGATDGHLPLAGSLVYGGGANTSLSELAIGTVGKVLVSNGSVPTWGNPDHGSLSDLIADDHTQYALLLGRSGGQTLIGGTASGDDLTLQSTSHATKGTIFFGASSVYDEVNSRFGILTTAPTNALSLGGEAARIIAMERRTASNTAGSALTIRSGGATPGATNKSSGSLTLATGISTGTGIGGNIIFQTPTKSASGTSDNSLTTRLSIAGTTGSMIATSSAATGSITGLTHNVTGSDLGSGGTFAGQVWNYSSIFADPASSYGLQMQLLLDSQTSSGGSAAAGFAFELYESNSLGPGTFGVDTNAVSGFIRHSSSPSGHVFTGFNVDVQTASGAGACDIVLYQTGASTLDANVTSWTAFHVVNPASTATVTTAYGLKIDNLTEATTSYAIYSAGGQSVHAGNLKLGDTTAPTEQLEFADSKNIKFHTTTGTKIGTATGQKLAFHNSTPVIQRAGAAQAAVVTTASTNITPYGYTTSAQADAIVTLVNEIRDTLVEKGLMKGSA